MKLKRESWWRHGTEFSVAEAVDAVCTPTFSNGTLDQLGDAREATAALVGRLVQELHAAGVLDHSAILRILGTGWKKAEG